MNHIDYFLDKGLSINATTDANLKIKGLSILQEDLKKQVIQYAQKNKWRIVFEIQTQNKSLEEKIETLWNKATQLEDWIDDPESDVPWQEKTKYVPQLQEMSLEIDCLKDQRNQNQLQQPVKKNPATPEIESIQPESCPARCKQSDQCYGIAYFNGKTGKSSVCVPDCPWAEQLNEYYFNKEN
jgi:hypothetical protein